MAFLLVQGAEMLVHVLYPPPAGTDIRDFNAVKRFVARLPPLGTFTAARMGRSAVPGTIVGALFLTAGIVNSIVIPQPVWFSVVSFIVYITMTLVGARVGSLTSPRSAVR